MRRFLVACLAASAFCGTPAYAWNNFGHMEVAAAAWEQLTPTAKAEAAKLLKRNPLYDKWTAGVASNDQARIAFIMAATWPDIIKQDPEYNLSDGSHNGDVPPAGSEASQNIGYTDKHRHKYWHFVDMPFSPDGTPTEDAKVPNAQTQIPILRAALANPSSDPDLRSYDMVWLLHLVGDVHQPLHTTSQFTHDLPDGDAGGNSVKIHCDVGSCLGARELHAFWDDLLGRSDASPQEAAAAAKKLAKPDAPAAAISDEKVWITESFEAAKKFAYHSPPIGNGSGPFQLSQKYQDDASTEAQERVALAGARLANLLNAALQ